MAVRVRRGAGLRRAARRSPLPLVALLYVTAALVATWPGIRSLASAFIAVGGLGDGAGQPPAGDHLQTVYRFWLVGHRLARGEAPWIDPYSFQPLVEEQTVLGGWPFGLAFWPLEAAFGPVLAWNVLLLATIAAAGLLTYAWLRTLALPPVAAAVGGLVFAIAPYRLAQSGGHLLGWIALALPLALLAVERSRSARSRRAAHGWGALGAAALVTIPLSGQVHLALGAVPLVLAYAALRYRLAATAWAVSGALASIGVGLLVRFTLIAGSIQPEGRSLEEVDAFSAEWGDFIDRWDRPSSEEFVYLGWLTPVLAGAGIVLMWRGGRRGLTAVLGLAAVVPVLLALGTNFPLYSALWEALPPFRFPRVPGRLLPVAVLAFAALAAVAAAWVIARAGRWSAAAAAGLVTLVSLDLGALPLEPAAADPDNAAYAAVRAAPAAARQLELPLLAPGVHFGSVYDYYALQSRRERPSGYSTLAPASPHHFAAAFNRLSCGAWLPGDRATLEGLGVTRILLHAGLYRHAEQGGAWFAWRGLLEAGYRPIARGGAVTLFAPGEGPASPPPVAEPPRERPALCEGWIAETTSERKATLWLFGEGQAELRVRTPQRWGVRLWVDERLAVTRPIAGSGTLTASLVGEGWHALLLGAPEPGLRLETIRLVGAP
jgi:hypothetical protein